MNLDVSPGFFLCVSVIADTSKKAFYSINIAKM